MAKNPVVKSFADVGAALAQHLADGVRHVTAAERNAWNGKAAGSHTHTASQISGLAAQVFKCGTYTGNADRNVSTPQYQDISLGFQPSFVIVWSGGSMQYTSYNRTYFYGGAAMPGYPVRCGDVNVIEVTAAGFRACYWVPTSGTIYTEVRANNPNGLYYYIAFR